MKLDELCEYFDMASFMTLDVMIGRRTFKENPKNLPEFPQKEKDFVTNVLSELQNKTISITEAWQKLLSTEILMTFLKEKTEKQKQQIKNQFYRYLYTSIMIRNLK